MPELDGELWRDIYYASFDDLKLYVRHYPAPDATLRTVICLPGLTRNSKDFHALATYLSKHPEKPRNVYCFDCRGRGRSRSPRTDASRLGTGSSATMMAGVMASAMAITTRWRWPPESSCG